ncbi:MAG: hypothetical protein AABY22_04680, partial [Nanoarchaeota archaeon]
MATDYPTSLDNFTNPNPQDSRVSPSHAAQHSNENDAIEAIETKLGINNSLSTGTIEYKLNRLRTGAPQDP